jgi:bifunctional non-homologous end joining protein LigD
MRRPAKPLLQEDEAARSKPARSRDPAQPKLPFDKMPDRFEPCLALLKTAPPQGPDLFYRAEALRKNSRIDRVRPTAI